MHLMFCELTKGPQGPAPLSADPVHVVAACACLCFVATAAGRPVMLVATGTTTVLPGPSVQAMAAAFAALNDIRFVWSLKQVCVLVCVCVCGEDRKTP